MLKITDQLSNKIANACFIAACLVVGIHAAPDARMVPFVCRIAVPFFFVISGFMLSGRCEQYYWYRSALSKRVRTLLVPYFLINGLWFPVVWVMHMLAAKYAGADPSSMAQLSWETPLEVLGLAFPSGPFAIGMWYVRTLMILVVLSPLFVCLLFRSFRASLIIILGELGFMMCCDIAKPDMSEVWVRCMDFGVPPYAIVCFSLGIVARRYLNKIIIDKRAALVLFVIVLLHEVLVGQGGLENLCRVMAIIPFFWIIPDKRLPKWCVDNAFPLFVLHPMVLYFIRFGLKGAKVESCIQLGVGYLILWMGVVLLTCAASCLLKKKLPRVSRIVFGGR